MSRKLILLYLFLFIPTALSTASEVKKEREFDLSKCEEKSGKEYWYENLKNEFTKRFKEIKKSDSQTYWTDGRGCYFAGNEEIGNKSKQLQGYARFLTWVYYYQHRPENIETINNILARLNNNTNKNFNSINEYIIWHYSNSEQSRIEDFEESDARAYWFYEYPYFQNDNPGFYNIEFMKNDQINWCNFGYGYDIQCRRISIADTKDPIPRTVAYMQRIEWDIGQYECNNSAKDIITAEKYNSLTAEDFPSFEQFHKWWYENREYINWSNEKGTFIVDNESKNKKNPIHEFELDVKSAKDPGASGYWSKIIRYADDKPPIKDRGAFLRVCDMGPHAPFSYTVSKSYVENIKNRESGYIHFLESTIEFLSQDPEYNNPKSPEEVYFPEHMLDQKFDTVKELVDWYNENKDNLVLSEDGKKLVVKEPSDKNLPPSQQ